MTRFPAAAADLLLAHGPLSPEDLHALAVERGLTRTKHPNSLMSSLAADRAFVQRPDGRWDAAVRLLQGQVFTTRPRTGLREGVVWAHRDLDPLALLPALPLLRGGELVRGKGQVECWLGPPGWLPALPGDSLLALRWTGTSLDASALDVPAGDADAVRGVREVLDRHARVERHPAWTARPEVCLARAVLSALVEAPDLFAAPLPPLRELLPLPEGLRPYEGGAPGTRDPRRIVEVPLPERVHDELVRRADLIGERLSEYAALLLGAAADRVQPGPREYTGYEAYDEPLAYADRGWRR